MLTRSAMELDLPPADVERTTISCLPCSDHLRQFPQRDGTDTGSFSALLRVPAVILFDLYSVSSGADFFATRQECACPQAGHLLTLSSFVPYIKCWTMSPWNVGGLCLPTSSACALRTRVDRKLLAMGCPRLVMSTACIQRLLYQQCRQVP